MSKTINSELAKTIANKYQQLEIEAPPAELIIEGWKHYDTDELLVILALDEYGGIDLAFGEMGDIGDGVLFCYITRGEEVTFDKLPVQALVALFCLLMR